MASATVDASADADADAGIRCLRGSHAGRVVCDSGGVLAAEQIATFDDAPPPPGESPWVDGQQPDRDVRIVAADPSWAREYARLAERVIAALGDDALIREPWWYEHRCLRHHDPASNPHVFSPDSPEAERHRIFRDWLRDHPEDRAIYQAAKVIAADETRAARGHTMDYNRRKQGALRQIYGRAFQNLGLPN